VTEPTTVARALDALTECWRILANPALGSLELDGMYAAGTGGAAPYCNQIIFFREPADARATLGAGIAFFDEMGVPFLAQIPDGLPVADLVREFGLARIDGNPFMVLDPIEGRSWHPVPVDLRVTIVRTEKELEPILAILGAAFGMAEDAVRSFALERYLQRNDCWMVTGSIDGEVVTTATSLLVDGLAGIFSVGTLEAFRGRGLGEAITAQSIRAAASAGARAAFLQASALGYPIYERMGFRTVASHTMYARR